MEKETILSEITSQDDLNEYIRKLPIKNECVFTIHRAIPLCSNNLRCPYKGNDDYPHMGERKRECKRDSILRQKRILGGKL